MRNRPWLKWVLIGAGVVVILVVAVKMIYEGWTGTGETLGIVSLLG